MNQKTKFARSYRLMVGYLMCAASIIIMFNSGLFTTLAIVDELFGVGWGFPVWSPLVGFVFLLASHVALKDSRKFLIAVTVHSISAGNGN